MLSERLRQLTPRLRHFFVRARDYSHLSNTLSRTLAHPYAQKLIAQLQKIPAPNSIGRRLLLASMIVLPLYLASIGWFLSRSFEASQLTAALERYRVQFYALLGATEFDSDGIKISPHTGDPRLRQINSGLYATIQRPQGEILWESPSSQALELSKDLLASDNPPRAGHERFDTIAHNAAYLRFQYQTVWESDDGEDIPLVFTILEDQSTLQVELRAFKRQLWLGLGSAAILLTIAQAVILRWGLQPLRRLAHDLTDLEQGKRAELPDRYPEELQPLATNLNQLLEREQKQRERYRNTLGDLAHSLKTPLAVLRQQSAADTPDRALLEEQIARMDQLIGYQLQRAVASSPHRLQQKILLRPLIDKLIATFSKVYFDKQLQFHTVVADDCECRADEADLLEVLGNLLDNACKACRKQIRISASDSERWLLIVIEDDGPGIPEQNRASILQRGQRADTYQPGQGIGLAVVIDIIDSYAAELDIGTSALGGARFSMRWPR
ncbi:MAG: ATP-binding protein [Spongiibacteraceae bacterium]